MAEKRPESLLSVLKSIGEFVLLVLGIVGIAVAIFHDQGLLRKLFTKLTEAAFSSSITAVVGAIMVLVVLKLWYNSVFSTAENSTALGNFLMRAMMLFGAYMLYRLLTTGSFKI